MMNSLTKEMSNLRVSQPATHQAQVSQLRQASQPEDQQIQPSMQWMKAGPIGPAPKNEQ
jgi:hypothetical protein